MCRNCEENSDSSSWSSEHEVNSRFASSHDAYDDFSVLSVCGRGGGKGFLELTTKIAEAVSAQHTAGAPSTKEMHGYTMWSALVMPNCPFELSPITSTAWSVSSAVVLTPSTTLFTRMLISSLNTQLLRVDPSPSCPQSFAPIRNRRFFDDSTATWWLPATTSRMISSFVNAGSAIAVGFATCGVSSGSTPS